VPRLRQDLGFAGAFVSIVIMLIWPGLRAAGGAGDGDMAGASATSLVLTVDPFDLQRSLWLDAVGQEFVPESSGMMILQETPSGFVVGAVDKSRKGDAGVAQLLYEDLERHEVALELDGRTWVSAGLLTGHDGRSYAIVALFTDPGPLLDPLVDQALSLPFLPFAPISRHVDADGARMAAAQWAELLGGRGEPVRAGPPIDPHTVLPTLDAGECRDDPGMAASPSPPGVNCALIWENAIRACQNEFNAEAAICAAALAACWTFKCGAITAGCTIFGFAFGAAGCAALCYVVCYAALAACFYAFNQKRHACMLRAHNARMLCEPGWQPKILDLTCGGCDA
jgi:hypothetical protein